MSPDGHRVAFIRGARGLDDANRISVFLMEANGTAVRRIGRGYGPQWAPHGSQLAYVDVLPDDPPELGALRTGRIMIVDVGANTARQVAAGTAPTWSPDSKQLAYMRYTFDVRDTWRGVRARTTGSALWVVGLDGSEPRRLVQANEEFLYTPAWSPDGRSIALVGDGVTLFDTATGEVRELPEIGPEIAWSPDGTRLLSTGSYPRDVRIVDVASGTMRVVAPERDELEYHFPVWSPDATRVAFVGCLRNDAPRCDVYTVGVDGSELQRLTRTPGIEGSLAWSPSG